jgi:hypothetical protein
MEDLSINDISALILKKFAIANKQDIDQWEISIISAFFINHIFSHFLNFTNGTIDTSYSEGFKRDAQDLLTLPTVQQHWQKAKAVYSVDFQKFVDEELMASSTASPTTPPIATA